MGSLRLRVSASLALLLIGAIPVAGFAYLLYRADSRDRAAQIERFADRARAAAGFTSGALQGDAASFRTELIEAFGGPRESLAAGFRAYRKAYGESLGDAVLLDRTGPLAADPASLVDDRSILGDRDIQRALEGRMQLSDVIPKGGVAYLRQSVPFPTKYGRRVLAESFPADQLQGELGGYLKSAPGVPSGTALVIDGNDRIVASGGNAPVGSPLKDAALAAALQKGPRGTYGEREFIETPIAGTTFRVVFTAERAELTQAGRGTRVMTWITFAAFAVVMLLAVLLAFRAREVGVQKRLVSELQALDKIKTNFVSTVSHELRTPLTSIAGSLEMLRDGDAGELNPDQDRMLELVDLNTRRLLTLIEDLLLLSRIESGTIRHERHPVSVGNVLERLLETTSPQVAAGELDLSVLIAPDLPLVEGDDRSLESALLNLISNAIKFTPPTGRIAVTARPINKSVEIVVADDGIGIPENEQDQLFTRFFRSSTAVDQAIQGTGLGLVIVKNVIEQHGGSIAVESRSGSGTTIRVTLPAMTTPTHEQGEAVCTAS